MELKIKKLSSMLEMNREGEMILDGVNGDILSYPVAFKEKLPDGSDSFKFGFGLTRFNKPIGEDVDEAIERVVGANEDERASLIILTGTTDKLRKMGRAIIRMADEMDKVK